MAINVNRVSARLDKSHDERNKLQALDTTKSVYTLAGKPMPASMASANDWETLYWDDDVRDARLAALAIVIEQQTVALQRKAAAYPALLKAHLRRRANAGDRTVKAV